MSCPWIMYSYYFSVFSGDLMKERETSKYIEFTLVLMAILWKLLRYFSHQPIHTTSGNTFQGLFIKVPAFIWKLKIMLLKGPVSSLHFAHRFKLCSSVELRSLKWVLKCCSLRTDIWHRISFLFRKLTARNLTHWAKLPSVNGLRRYVKERLISKLLSS